jgi:hypothetical protein
MLSIKGLMIFYMQRPIEIKKENAKDETIKLEEEHKLTIYHNNI